MLFRTLISLAALGPAAPAPSAPSANCRANMLTLLEKHAPDGLAVWNALSADGKKQLAPLIRCDAKGGVDPLDAETLVHESVHVLGAERGYAKTPGAWRSFRLVSGEWEEVDTGAKDYAYEHARGQALRAMSEGERTREYVRMYLYDLGNQELFGLLDELNAYTHGLHAANTLPPSKDVVSSRDGPVAFLVFTLRYLEAVESNSPEYYADRVFAKSGEVSGLIRRLFDQAYRAINASCALPRNSLNDAAWFESLGTAASRKQLARIYPDGKAPVVDPKCVENAKLDPARPDAKAVPVDFPKEAREVASGATKDGDKTSTTTVVPTRNRTLTVRLNLELKPHDPTKPSMDARVVRIDDLNIRVVMEWGGHRLERFYTGEKGKSNSIRWDGVPVTQEELNRITVDHQEFVRRSNNPRYVVEKD